MEAEFLRPNPDHPPCVEQDDRNRHGVEHGLRGQTEAFLDVPKAENPQRLGCDADDEQVGQVQSIVGNDGVLQGADDGDGGVERVAEEEVAWFNGISNKSSLSEVRCQKMTYQ